MTADLTRVLFSTDQCTWLHGGCMDTWRAAYDELNIPDFLDRRGEAR
jgi:hypothetical protein